MNQIFIGLGSNQDEPYDHIKKAITDLDSWSDAKVRKVSSFYQSKPFGGVQQADFINAVVLIEASMQPLELLNRLQELEHQHGRASKHLHWGPRPLDLDILLFNNEILNTEILTIPHPGMVVRSFVLLPLVEISPLIEIPGAGYAKDFLNRLLLNDIQKVSLW